jgi:hypothetical protein
MTSIFDLILLSAAASAFGSCFGLSPPRENPTICIPDYIKVFAILLGFRPGGSPHEDFITHPW